MSEKQKLHLEKLRLINIGRSYPRGYKLWDKKPNPNLGKKRSSLTKLKISLSLMGKPRPTYFHSEEFRKKISESTRKKWLDPIFKEKTSNSISKALKGRKFSLETRRKISQSKRIYPDSIKNIILSLRDCLEYRQWRNSVFRRDNWTCIECGKKTHLNADHIIPFALIIRNIILEQGSDNLFDKALKSNILWDINNGRTLCIICHKKTDTYLKRIDRILTIKSK